MKWSNLPDYVRRLWWDTKNPLSIRMMGVKLGPHIRFHGVPIISHWPGSQIEIGARCVMTSDSRYTALGVNHPIVLRTLSSLAHLKIGADCGLSGTTICASVSVEIGQGCLIGANVTIVDTDFHSVKKLGRRYNNSPDDIECGPVVIEEDVFIGAYAIILKNLTIGSGSVIGAGAVITKDIPKRSIVAGNPARVIGIIE